MISFQANATGRLALTVRNFLEKNYKLEDMKTEHDTVKLAIRALLEVVQSGRKNLEIAVMRKGEAVKVCAICHISYSQKIDQTFE